MKSEQYWLGFANWTKRREAGRIKSAFTVDFGQKASRNVRCGTWMGDKKYLRRL